MKHCNNCGKAVHGNYCSHCGEKTKIERITFSYLWHETFHFLTHLETGFFFTTYQLIIRPGATVINFVEGTRKKYQSPVSYFLIWITFYVIFLYWAGNFFGNNVVIDYHNYFGPGSSTEFGISHLALVLTIVIPFQALYLFLLVSRGKWYYFETAVATIFTLGTVIFFQFVFAVLAVIIHLISGASVDIRLSDLFKVSYILWFSFSFVYLFPVKYKLVRIIAFIILAFGTFTLWRLFGFPKLIEWVHH
jgi:hypothetical protein